MVTGEEIRRRHLATYNATVAHCYNVHEDLRILRVIPDVGRLHFVPGQYTTLGLCGCLPCNDDPSMIKPTPTLPEPDLIKRPYSISCSMLGPEGELLTTKSSPYLEFYITQVHFDEASRPHLSPRLFALTKGQRLFVGPRAHGHYTLTPVRRDEDVILMATGTGEAPHNAMIADLLAGNHRGQIVCISCVRHKRDLAYLERHRELEHRFANYHYVALTTREPQNIDSTRNDYVGKQYLQDFVTSGRLDEILGRNLDPARAHAYLCGNPAMVGIPHRTDDGAVQYPQPTGMIEILQERGFRMDEPSKPGNIHFEKYW